MTSRKDFEAQREIERGLRTKKLRRTEGPGGEEGFAVRHKKDIGGMRERGLDVEGDGEVRRSKKGFGDRSHGR
jgi:hypothetical protein